MWIRTTIGNYINADNIFDVAVKALPSGDYSVTAYTTEKDTFDGIAIFHSKAEAQNFLDKFMKKFGPIAVADMSEWNYTGHRKDHKETRRGGS